MTVLMSWDVSNFSEQVQLFRLLLFALSRIEITWQWSHGQLQSIIFLMLDFALYFFKINYFQWISLYAAVSTEYVWPMTKQPNCMTQFKSRLPSCSLTTEQECLSWQLVCLLILSLLKKNINALSVRRVGLHRNLESQDCIFNSEIWYF